MRRLPLLAAIIPLLLAGPRAAGQDLPDLVTDRPDQTESSVTVPPDHVQIETGAAFARDDTRGGRDEETNVAGTLVRVGVAPRFELRFGWAGWIDGESRVGGMRESANGPGDLDLGFKLGLVEERGARPRIAVIAGTTIPSGANEVSSRRADPFARLSLSHELSDRVGLGYNVGLRWDSSPDATGERDTVSVALYTAALGIGVTERLGAFVELFGETGLWGPGGVANGLDGGVTYLVRDNLQLDASVGLGLSDRATDRFVGVGLSLRLPR